MRRASLCLAPPGPDAPPSRRRAPAIAAAEERRLAATWAGERAHRASRRAAARTSPRSSFRHRSRGAGVAVRAALYTPVLVTVLSLALTMELWRAVQVSAAGSPRLSSSPVSGCSGDDAGAAARRDARRPRRGRVRAPPRARLARLNERRGRYRRRAPSRTDSPVARRSPPRASRRAARPETTEHRLANVASEIAGRNVDVHCPGIINVSSTLPARRLCLLRRRSRPREYTDLNDPTCSTLDHFADGRTESGHPPRRPRATRARARVHPLSRDPRRGPGGLLRAPERRSPPGISGRPAGRRLAGWRSSSEQSGTARLPLPGVPRRGALDLIPARPPGPEGLFRRARRARSSRG